MQKKFILFVIGSLLIGNCFAAKSEVSAPATPVATAAKPTTPHINATCTPVKLPKSQNKNIVLDGSATSRIYLIKNRTQKSIWLDHPVKHTGASAGWSSYLKPGDWSALWVDKNDFSISCSVIAPGKMETLECTQALSVCNPTHLVYSSHRKSTFWLVEGKPWKELLKGLQARGVK